MGVFSMISITYQLGKNQVILIVYDQSRRPKAKTYIKKIRPLAEGISRSGRYEVSFRSPSGEVECIKYHILDFCKFPFENNRILLW